MPNYDPNSDDYHYPPRHEPDPGTEIDRLRSELAAKDARIKAVADALEIHEDHDLAGQIKDIDIDYRNLQKKLEAANARIAELADKGTLQALRDANARAEQAEAERDALQEQLASAVKIANEAAEEWDKAPAGMRAGKILLALAGHRKGYRPDTDAIHSALNP